MFVGSSRRSRLPASTDGALSFSTACSATRRASATSGRLSTYSQPAWRGGELVCHTLSNSPRLSSTAVTEYAGPRRTSSCSTYAPSVDANSFHSAPPVYDALTNFTPGTFIASRVIASRSSALSSSGILNGSLTSGDCHTSTAGVTGASTTGRFWNTAL